MGPTILNKSPKYGDLKQGYAVSAAVSSMIPNIDIANPAVVKYARLLLGTREALRDSLDDIASYAAKDDGQLSCKPNHDLPEDAKLALHHVKMHTADANLTPTKLAYVVAFFGCIRRGECEDAYKVLSEYCDYCASIGDDVCHSNEFSTLIFSANSLTKKLQELANKQPPVATTELLRSFTKGTLVYEPK